MWKVTPPFSRTYVDAAGSPFTWWTGIVADLIFWKKILNFFILSGSGPGTSSGWFSGSALFSASSSSCYQRVFNFLSWKPLHMVHLTSEFHFFRSDLPREVVFRPKSWKSTENVNVNFLQTRLSLKTRLSPKSVDKNQVARLGQKTVEHSGKFFSPQNTPNAI